MPDLRPCSSLHSIALKGCYEVRNLEGADCPCVKELFLNVVCPYNYEKLLDFDCLESLEELCVDAASEVDNFQAQWNRKVDGGHDGLEATLEGEGPCAKLLEELSLLFCRSNNMTCKFIGRFPGRSRPGGYTKFDELMEMFDFDELAEMFGSCNL